MSHHQKPVCSKKLNFTRFQELTSSIDTLDPILIHKNAKTILILAQNGLKSNKNIFKFKVLKLTLQISLPWKDI